MKESAVASHIRLLAAQLGIHLWRNNSGACKDETGRVIRYGLMNDSANLNKRIKSSDFIGVLPVVITPDMVGKTVGVFVAVETKAEGWKYSPSDERAVAQAAFHAIVRQQGGLAGFAQSVEDFLAIVRR